MADDDDAMIRKATSVCNDLMRSPIAPLTSWKVFWRHSIGSASDQRFAK